MIGTTLSMNLQCHKGKNYDKEYVGTIIKDNLDYKDLLVSNNAHGYFNINVYQMGFTEQNEDVGRMQKELFILNACSPNGQEITNDIYGTIMEVDNHYTNNTNNANVELFYDELGTVIAVYIGYMNTEHNSSNRCVLFILPDLFSEELTSDGRVKYDVFKKLMVEFNQKVVSKWEKQVEWGKLNKEEMYNILRKFFLNKNIEGIERNKRRLDRVSDDIESYRRNLIEAYKKYSMYMKDIKQLEQSDDSLIDKFIKELELIKNYEKVETIQLIGEKLIVETLPLDIYDSDDNRYYGGKYIIEINIEEYSIKFDTDNRRPGYWSDNDVHPHISKHGNACLGSAEPICIELINQTEYYALVLTLIDFLQNANLSDVAGEKVKNWDMYDENGELIEANIEDDREYDWYCEECHMGMYYDDDSNDAITEDGDSITVCNQCLAEYYHYDDEEECYIHD